MVLNIVWHAIRKNLHDLRLVVLLGLSLLAFLLSGISGADDLIAQHRRLAELEIRALEQSNLDAAIVVRPFNPLRFIHTDLDSLPDYLVVSPEIVDYSSEDLSLRDISANKAMLDWTFVFTYVVSISCLMLTFDSISGEAERGTLRLLIATGCSRRAYFWGTLVGSFLTIGAVTILGCLLSIFPLLLKGIDFESQHWSRLVCVMVFLLSTVLVFISFGILASSLASSPEVSLLIAVSVWLAAVFVVPMGAVLVAERVSRIPSATKLEADLEEARRRFFRQSYPLSSADIDQIEERYGLNDVEKKTAVERLQREIDRQNDQAFQNYRERLTEIRETYLKALLEQVETTHSLARVSPVAAYREIASSLVGSDLAGQELFVQQAKTFRLEFAQYAALKRQQVRERAQLQEIVIEQSGFTIRNIQGISFLGLSFDRSSFPRFHPSPPLLISSLKQALPAVIVLGLVCAVALALGYLRFLHYPWL